VDKVVWQAETREIAGGLRFTILDEDGPVSFRRLFTLLHDDVKIADWVSDVVSGFDCDACYWELPPLTTTTMDDDAEFVLLDAPTLARLTPEPEVFASHFQPRPDDGIAVFQNLGGDAVLVVPCPPESGDGYPHLTAFLRRAPPEQVRALWQSTAGTLLARLDARPIWLNTAGLGVAWLHVRLDSWPKYYRYAPYTQEPEAI
jgi:hypothetical protein